MHWAGVDWVVGVAVVLLSLVIGSFLNVVIYRLPKQIQGEQINIAYPMRSFCPHCHHTLGVIELIPVMSYLIQRGSCRQCQAKISPQYPLVEVITVILSMGVICGFGVSVQSGFILLLVYCLICLFVIDWQNHLLPDVLTLPLLWLGLLLNSSSVALVDVSDAVYGAVFGYLLLWSVYWLFKLVRKKEGMGYGDFKLLAALGAWFGWQSLPVILLVASVLGLLFALLSRNNLSAHFAFGPFLIVAALVVLIESL